MALPFPKHAWIAARERIASRLDEMIPNPCLLVWEILPLGHQPRNQAPTIWRLSVYPAIPTN